MGVTQYYDGTPRYDGGWKTFSRSGDMPPSKSRAHPTTALGRPGKGNMKFVSGTHYEGNWEDGCIQVRTQLRLRCVSECSDRFYRPRQSEAETPCKCTFYNGDVYEGEWAVRTPAPSKAFARLGRKSRCSRTGAGEWPHSAAVRTAVSKLPPLG